jgi:hypothetical protein
VPFAGFLSKHIPQLPQREGVKVDHPAGLKDHDFVVSDDTSQLARSDVQVGGDLL